VWGALYAAYLFARCFLDNTTSLAAPLLTAFFPIWGFLGIGAYYAYPYDFPAMMFSTACLWTIVSGRFRLLVVFVVLGTLTKESIVWILPAYVLFNQRAWKADRTLLLRSCVLLIVFLLAYKLPRLWLDPSHGLFSFTVQPTTQGQTRLARNLALLIPSHAVANVYLPFLLHLPSLLFFRRLPEGLQRLYAATPVFVAPIFLFGNINEIRLFNELAPLGAVGALYMVTRMGPRSSR
jgi:hypothetical protein